MIRRGALLLEVLLSVSLFVMAAIAILSVLGDALSRLGETRERLEASDLAYTAMAAIDSGLYDVSALNGPVPEGGLLADDDLESGGVAMRPAPDEMWTLEIETEPSAFEGLTLVTVSVVRGDDAGSVGDTGIERAPVFTLRQLVADRESARDAGASSATGGFRSGGGGS